MPSIITRTISDGSTTYQVRWREHGQQRSVSSAGATDRERKRNAERIRDIVKVHGTYVEEYGRTDVPTLAEWAEQYLEHGTRANAATVEDYRRTIDRHILPSLGSLALTALTRDVITVWARQVPGKDKTRANVMALLSGILKHAVPEWLPSNPCDRVRLQKTDPPRDVARITAQDFGLLLDCLPHRHYRPLVAILATTGIRWGEAAALTVADVDLTGELPKLRVTKAVKHRARQTDAPGRPKTERSTRIVTTPAEMAGVLAALVEGRPRTAPLFTALRGGRMRNSTFHTLEWQPAVDEAQKRGLTYRPRIHDLRAAAVTWLIEGKVPIDVVADQMGHESVTTTFNIYRRVNPEAGQLAAAAMSKMLAGADRPALED